MWSRIPDWDNGVGAGWYRTFFDHTQPLSVMHALGVPWTSCGTPPDVIPRLVRGGLYRLSGGMMANCLHVGYATTDSQKEWKMSCFRITLPSGIFFGMRRTDDSGIFDSENLFNLLEKEKGASTSRAGVEAFRRHIKAACVPVEVWSDE